MPCNELQGSFCSDFNNSVNITVANYERFHYFISLLDSLKCEGLKRILQTGETDGVLRYAATYQCQALVHYHGCKDNLTLMCKDSCYIYQKSLESAFSLNYLCSQNIPMAIQEKRKNLINEVGEICQLRDIRNDFDNCIIATPSESQNCGFGSSLPGIMKYEKFCKSRPSENCCRVSDKISIQNDQGMEDKKDTENSGMNISSLIIVPLFLCLCFLIGIGILKCNKKNLNRKFNRRKRIEKDNISMPLPLSISQKDLSDESAKPSKSHWNFQLKTHATIFKKKQNTKDCLKTTALNENKTDSENTMRLSTVKEEIITEINTKRDSSDRDKKKPKMAVCFKLI
jgi:hypothetical protein